MMPAAAVERWEDEGGAIESEPAAPLPVFLGRPASLPMLALGIAVRASRKRMERVAWLVGFGLLVLVILNVSGLLTFVHP